MNPLKLITLVFVLSTGCAVPVPRESTSGGFPHPAGYADNHGADSLAEGASCLSCHSVEPDALVQGVSPQAPSCKSCHEAFPHEAGYGTTAAHGADWLADATRCADCHGAGGERAPVDLSRGQCVACHAGYPHPSGWETAAGHGAAVLDRGTDQACTSCHTKDGEDPATCASCHPAYPHTEGWASGAAHGAASQAGTSCGESCHPADPATAAPRLACQSCHDLFPHADGWPVGHIPVVQARGEAVCQGCHEAGTPAGGPMPVSCAAACHAETP